MSENAHHNKRIAKNTIMLYIRMFLIVCVTLYTSRIILQVLGIQDFGIYNIVGGIIVFFSFLQNALTSATQRFINYELGKNNTSEVKKIFNTSIIVYFLICIIILFFSETIGVWYIKNYLNIPHDRIEATHWVFQISIFTALIQIMRMPYNATIIAYEKMSFYSFVSILEALLTLLVVFLLMSINTDYDKLKLYSFFILLANLIIFFVYKIYCNLKIKTTHFHFFFDRSLFSNMLTFSGWSLFGSLAVVGVNQGIALILNFFYGVFINASLGIANQVSTAVNKFILSFQTAFSPQIVKSYANEDFIYLRTLVERTSKYSYCLMLIPCIPILFEINYILNLWLGEIPSYAASFTRITLLYMLIDSLAAPFFSVIYASGKIKKYQMIISLLMSFNVLLVFVFLKLGFSVISALSIRIIISAISMIVRVFLVDKLIYSPFIIFFKKVFIPVTSITAISIVIPFFIYFKMDEGLLRLILIVITSTISVCGAVFYIGLNNDERILIINKIMRFR